MMRLSPKSLTLIELLFTFSILAFILCGLLLTYINMFLLTDLSRDLMLATNSVQAKMEEIKKAGFDCLSPCLVSCNSHCFNNAETFDLTGIAQGKGRIEIYSTQYNDLKRVRIVASFRTRGRLIGEDINLNGALDPGEDLNGNGRLDASVEVVTLISFTN